VSTTARYTLANRSSKSIIVADLTEVFNVFVHVTDVNECAVNNGGCSADATCDDTPGSYVCAGKTGFAGNGTSCTGTPYTGNRDALVLVSNIISIIQPLEIKIPAMWFSKTGHVSA